MQKMLDKLISFKNPDIQTNIIDKIPMKGRDCDFTRPLTIYGYPNLLYMRNLLVGKSTEVKENLFSVMIFGGSGLTFQEIYSPIPCPTFSYK